MIELLIDGEALEISSGTEFQFTLRSEFISRDDQGKYSLDLQIPWTPKNHRLLKFAGHTEINSKTLLIDVEMRFLNRHQADAKLLLFKSSRRKSFQASLLIESIIVDMHDVNIKEDVALGTKNYSDPHGAGVGSIAFDRTHTYDPDNDTYPLNWPYIYGPNFWSENEFFSSGHQIINGDIYLDFSLDGADRCMVPCLYLMYVLKKCVAHFGYDIDGDFFNDTEMRTLLLFNTQMVGTRKLDDHLARGTEVARTNYTGLNQPMICGTEVEDTDSVFTPGTPPLYNIAQQHAYEIELSGFFEEGTGDTCTIRTLKGGVKWGDDQVIDMKTNGTHRYYKLKWQTAVAVPGDVGQDISFDITFDAPTGGGYITDLKLSIRDYTIAQRVELYSGDVVMNDHAPDKTVSEFIDHIADFFGLRYRVDTKSNKFYLDFIKDVFEDPQFEDQTFKTSSEYIIEHEDKGGYLIKNNFIEGLGVPDSSKYESTRTIDSGDELADPPNYSELVFVRNSQEYFHNVQNPDTLVYTWERCGEANTPIIIGDGETEIQKEVSPMCMTNYHRYENLGTTDEWILLPITRKNGSSDAYIQEGDDPGLQLMFFRSSDAALDSDSTGNSRAGFANVDAYDYDFDQVFSYSLLMNTDAFSLYEQFHRALLEFLHSSEEVEMIQEVKVVDLFGDDFGKWIRINKSIYLIKERILSVSGSRIGLSKIKALRDGR